MFSWLKWGKPAHAMADVKTTRQSVAGLSARDPAKELDKVAARLDSINQPAEFDLPQRWAKR